MCYVTLEKNKMAARYYSNTYNIEKFRAELKEKSRARDYLAYNVQASVLYSICFPVVRRVVTGVTYCENALHLLPS